MSTLNEPSVCEHVLYRGKGKQKWEQRIVSIKRSGCNGKYLLKVAPTQRKRKLWRRPKKPETVELTSNSHAIIHLDSLGNQRNVVGILALRGDSQIRGHFFSSECGEKLNNLKALLAKCCDVVSFDVDFEEVPNSSPWNKAQLHICNDRICLSTNLEYDFKLLGEWRIDSLSQQLMAHGVVTLNMMSEAQEEKTLLLRTERGHEICSKLTERRRCLAPADHGHQPLQFISNSVAVAQQCDSNYNIMSASSLSKSCELLHEICSEPLPSNSKTLPSSRVKPSFSLTELSSVTYLTSNIQAKSPLSSDGSIYKDRYGSTNSSSSARTEQGSNGDNEFNVQKQLELTTHKVHADGNGTEDREESSTRENHIQGEHLPPPIPQRKLKPAITCTEQVKNELRDAKCSDRSIYGEELVIQRSRSFQIVGQPPSSPKRQRVKSDSSLNATNKTAGVITELVRPIRLDQPQPKPANHPDTYMDLQANRAADTEKRRGVCSPKHNERNKISCAITQDGVDNLDLKPTAVQSRALTHTYCMPATVSDAQVADGKSQFEDKVDSSDSTCHYVNLPEGSRPSCYLYMNLPDSRKTPKEAASCVSHVFMSRSMKGIYENVQQFCNEKFETAVLSEECASPPPLPPPALQPRQPPPRIPKRVSKDSKGAQKPPVALPVETRDCCGPPPPRPPKKQGSVTKEGLSIAQQDIQVTIAVFASKAVSGRVWFLRIVVMKHDPDDTTFKMVKDREIASKYHLIQTYPFSISSDIVVSLKHQCLQFKLTSEDYQEVGYNIIENLVHGFWFVIEFHLEHMGSYADQFVGNVCVEPKDLPVGERCPVNKRFNLGITEDFELKQNCSCDQHGNHHTRGNQAWKPVIPDYAKRKEICTKLDITLYSRNNWRDVAGHLGFHVEEIKSLDDKAQKCPNFSPMEHVLTTWEQRDPECSLDRLVGILQDIQRHDIVSDLGFTVNLESF